MNPGSGSGATWRLAVVAWFAMWVAGAGCMAPEDDAVESDPTFEGGVEDEEGGVDPEWEGGDKGLGGKAWDGSRSDEEEIVVPFAGGIGQANNSLGIWLWHLEGTGMASHGDLANALAAIGVKRIYVKVADGSYDPSKWPEVNDATVPKAYLDRGIEPFAWSYNYPGNDAAQAMALYQAAKAGYRGYVLDVEVELDGKVTQLHSLFKAFSEARKKAQSDGLAGSGFRLYATTWGNPKDHKMHVEVIDLYVDGHMPQTYLEAWGPVFMATPAATVKLGTDEYRALGCKKPVQHILSAEEGKIQAWQIDAAFAASGPESSLWRVPGGGTPQSIWNTLKAVDWHKDFGAGQSGSVTLSAPAVFVLGQSALVSGTTKGAVTRVRVTCDGYLLADLKVDGNGNYAFQQTFNKAGKMRSLVAEGLDSGGKVLAQAKSVVDVLEKPLAEVATLTLVSPLKATVGIPAPFSGTASGGIVQVVVAVDGWQVADPPIEAGKYSFLYSFNQPGAKRMVVARGYDKGFNVVAQEFAYVDVLPGTSTANLTFLGPSTAVVGKEVVFSGGATKDVVDVEVLVDTTSISTLKPAGKPFQVKYTFWEPGLRTVMLRGRDSSGTVLAEKSLQIEVLGVPKMTFVEPGTTALNPVTMKVQADSGIVSVKYYSQGFYLGSSTGKAGGFSVTYEFDQVGERTLEAEGLGADGSTLASAQAKVKVFDPGTLAFTMPSGAAAANPVTFAVAASPDVVKVRYEAEGKWLMGESTDALNGFAMTYEFNQLGKREVHARGFNSGGKLVVTAVKPVEVTTSAPAVPYLYQYSNQLSPGATCSQTSVAMLLAWYGWKGKPDDITAKYGVAATQSPAGLASVFNDYAKSMGVPQRLKAHTDGTIEQVNALLAKGKPVIVHGYFTSAGHVLVLLEMSGTDYVVNDPAGKWTQVFKGGYPSGWNPTAGKLVKYGVNAVYDAIATWDGGAPAPIWYHEIVE